MPNRFLPDKLLLIQTDPSLANFGRRWVRDRRTVRLLQMPNRFLTDTLLVQTDPLYALSLIHI